MNNKDFNVDQSDKSKKYITNYSFKLKISLFKLNTLRYKKKSNSKFFRLLF